MTHNETFYFCWVRLPDDHYYRTLCSLEVVLKASHPLLDKNIRYLLFPYSVCQLFHGTSCRGVFCCECISSCPHMFKQESHFPPFPICHYTPPPLTPVSIQTHSGHLPEPGIMLGAVLVGQSYPTLCNPMDCSPPGSSVHGIFQARILEWIAISFSRGSSQPRDQTRVSRSAGRLFTI